VCRHGDGDEKARHAGMTIKSGTGGEVIGLSGGRDNLVFIKKREGGMDYPWGKGLGED